VPLALNPLDEHALEAAVRVKEAHGAHVVAISMGPPTAEQVLRHALAMGCDMAVLISDRALVGSDTLATATALAAGVRKLGGADLVICGDHSSDGDTGQVGPELAEILGVPQATYAIGIEIKGERIRVRRLLTGAIETVMVPLPALVTVVKDIGKPRRPGLRGLRGARSAEILRWNAQDLGLTSDKIGLSGSPTKVLDLRKPLSRPGIQKFEVGAAEAASRIAELLTGEGLRRECLK
jgi:electron transfer flavoprotein beta subunit